MAVSGDDFEAGQAKPIAGDSINRRILSGAIWVIAARWAIRGIGFISTLVLVRLLSPADFGLVAMAMLIVGTLEVFGETGLVLFLIRHPDPQGSHFNTVWTLRVIIGAVLSGLLLMSAPIGAQFFNDAGVTAIIAWLSLRPLMQGLENPGTIWFRKDMNFRLDFHFMVVRKIVAFIVTITLAITLRNYWALVFGILAGGATALIQSYHMHPYRPRLDLSRTREVWSFSFWMLAQHLLVFWSDRIDELVIGRVKSTAALGLYSVSSDIAASPVREIVIPLSRSLFPGFVQLVGNPGALVESFSKALSGVAIIACPVSVGIALIASDFTIVFLGDRWLGTIPMLQMLAISAGVFALCQPVFPLLGATDRARAAAMLSMLRLGLLVAAVVPAAIYYGLPAVALGRLVAMTLATGITLIAISRLAKIPLSGVVSALTRPMIATLIMAGAVISVNETAPDIPALRMTASAIVGGLTFSLALIGVWRLQGCPDGPEASLIALLRRRFAY